MKLQIMQDRIRDLEEKNQMLYVYKEKMRHYQNKKKNFKVLYKIKCNKMIINYNKKNFK